MTADLPATMRAWQSPQPGIAALCLAELPCPQPGPGGAVIRVEAAALNFSDLLMIDGRYQVRPDRPFVPGQEVAGTVVAADARSGLSVGQRVASKVEWGGFADYAAVRGDMALAIPADMDIRAAAALPVVYTTAMVALTESTRIVPGNTVLVLAAAGGVGLAAVEIARHLGGRVIALAGGPEKAELARARGAHEALDYRREGWSEEVKRLTGGQGADIVVDPVGGAATAEALRCLAWEGRLLVVGFSSGKIPDIPANRLLLKRASAIGVYWNHDRDAAMLARVAERILSFVAAGAIRPHIGGAYGFGELPAALAALAERRTTGKLIVLGNGSEDRA